MLVFQNKLFFYFFVLQPDTTDFMKKVLSVYTHSKTTIYLSLSAQVAKSTFFMKSPVCALLCKLEGFCIISRH